MLVKEDGLFGGETGIFCATSRNISPTSSYSRNPLLVTTQIRLSGKLKTGPTAYLVLADCTGTGLKVRESLSKRKISVLELTQTLPWLSQKILVSPFGNLKVLFSLPSKRCTARVESIQRNPCLSFASPWMVPGWMPYLKSKSWMCRSPSWA